MGRLALDQVNRVLDDQSRTMEEQSRKNERAARFAVGLVVVGIAAVSLVATFGWDGSPASLVVVMAALTLFFVQAGVTMVGLIRVSTSSDVLASSGVGPSPPDVVEQLAARQYTSEKEILQSFLMLARRLFTENHKRIEKYARIRDRFVMWNLTSTTWLFLAAVLYIQEVLIWI